MTLSPGLAAYLAFSERGANLAESKLEKRLLEGKEDRDRLAERRGIASASRPEGLLIWFHAASVGESLSILELVRRLADQCEEAHFLLTSGTVTSAAMIAARLPERAVHQYVPVDVRPFVRRFLAHWRPDLAVWTESELWPALIHETDQVGVPMVLISGKLAALRVREYASRAVRTRRGGDE